MASIAADTEYGVNVGLRLPKSKAEQLDALAAAKFRGVRSQAILFLIDLYAGKEVERAAQELEQESAPVPVTKWKAPKLSLELVAYLAGLVRAGNLISTACVMAGVSPRQQSSWFKQGRNDLRDGRETLQSTLVAALDRAEGECEAEDIARIRAHGDRSFQPLAWRLERQHPDRYGERKRVDKSVQHSLTPLIDYDRLTAAEAKTLVMLLRKASPELGDPAISRSARPAIELVPDDVIEAVDGEWRELGQGEAPPLEAAAIPKPDS